MFERPLRIAQVGCADVLGGAEKIGWDLFRFFRQLGHTSWLLVGNKVTDDRDVFPIPVEYGRWFSFCRRLFHRFERQQRRRPIPQFEVLGPWLWDLAQPGKWWDRRWGRHDFRFPGTWKLLDLPPQRPDVVHCHTLHQDYFDLRFLPRLSRQVPVVVSLHDAWLLAGLCCHPYDCERWQTGCGRCPRLHVWQDASVSKRDSTAANWGRKRAVYAKSRLHVTTACHWLMRKVERSMLMAGTVETRVIPYGIDLSLFRPAVDREAVREVLNIEPGTRVLFYVGRGLEESCTKDYANLRAAVDVVAARRPDQRFLLLARGAHGEPARYRNIEVRRINWTNEFRDVARYYQAADVYVHATKADTFPLSVLESLACGTPVVGSAVGGVMEQIKSLRPDGAAARWKPYGADEATGILVPQQDSTPLATCEDDARSLADAIDALIGDEPLRRRLARNAVRDARARFSFQGFASTLLDWYSKLSEKTSWEARALPAARA